MGTYKYEPGQMVFVLAKIENVIIDEEHGTLYNLKILDHLFTQEGQNNIQHVVGIIESDIEPYGVE